MYLSAKIYGNPHANSGFMPIASFNATSSFEVPDVEYGGLSDNSYFFLIKTTAEHVMYTLVKNQVYSYSQNAETRLGSLKIAITIPKDYKLAENHTPYDVLIQFKNHFLASCMKCISPTRDAYQFIGANIDQHILDDVARQYELVPHVGPYRPMIGNKTGCITTDDNNIKLLLSDVQYTEFTNYKEIIVAKSCTSDAYDKLQYISIPRQSEYKIIVDGKYLKTVKDVKEEIEVIGKKDTKFYVNNTLRFTIEGIKANNSQPDILKLDEALEEIHVNTQTLSKKREQTLYLVIRNDELLKNISKNANAIQLSYNNRAISVQQSDLSIKLVGEELAALQNPSELKVVLSTLAGSFKITTIKINADKLVIDAQKIVKTASLDNCSTPSYFTEISLKLNKHSYDNVGHLDVNIVDEEDKKLQTSKVTFREESENYVGVVCIPKAWASKVVYVQFIHGKYVYQSRIIQKHKVNSIEISTKELEAGKYKFTFFKKLFTRRIKLMMMLLGLLLGLGGGFGAGYFLYPTLTQEQEVTTEKPTTPDQSPTPKKPGNDTIVTTIDPDTTNTDEESADVQEETTKEETTKTIKTPKPVSKSSGVSTNQAANTEVKPVDQTFKCSMCGESFNTDRDRKRHERSQCQKLIQCGCGFKYRPEEFEAHKKTCNKK